MSAAARAWWRALRHLNHRGYLYIWANVLWVLLSLPIVTAPAAWAGLVRMSYHAYRSPAPSMDAFWQGFRENLKRGAALAILNLLVIGVNVINIAAYRDVPGAEANLLRAVWTITLVVWLGLQFYLWPLMERMEQPAITGGLRNAAVMMARNPLYTAVAWLIAFLIVVLCILLTPAWLLLLGSVLAVGANSLVSDRLQAAGLEKPLPSDEQIAAGALGERVEE